MSLCRNNTTTSFDSRRELSCTPRLQRKDEEPVPHPPPGVLVTLTADLPVALSALCFAGPDWMPC